MIYIGVDITHRCIILSTCIVLPLQVVPSPVNPAIQEHSYPPSLFVQLAYSLQLFSCWSEHSSISAGINHSNLYECQSYFPAIITRAVTSILIQQESNQTDAFKAAHSVIANVLTASIIHTTFINIWQVRLSMILMKQWWI